MLRAVSGAGDSSLRSRVVEGDGERNPPPVFVTGRCNGCFAEAVLQALTRNEGVIIFEPSKGRRFSGCSVLNIPPMPAFLTVRFQLIKEIRIDECAC